MIAKCATLSQISIPEEITSQVGISAGDSLHVAVHGGKIILAPINEKLRVGSDPFETEERMEIVRSLFGSIDDPTFVEQPDVEPITAKDIDWKLMDI